MSEVTVTHVLIRWSDGTILEAVGDKAEAAASQVQREVFFVLRGHD